MRNRVLDLVALSLAGGLVFCGAAEASGLDSTFEIVRKGEPIGFHAVTVEETPDGVKVETTIKMRVKFGPIVLFRYDHQSTEVWKDGGLQSLESVTNNNGDDKSLTVRREGDQLLIDGAAFKGAAAADAIPSSYWNKEIVKAGSLLNTQTGEVIDVSIESLGEAPAPNGAQAEHYRLTGTVALDLWYEGPRWVGSDFVVRGEALSYRLIEDDKILAPIRRSGAGQD
jgi:hypothetical protein